MYDYFFLLLKLQRNNAILKKEKSVTAPENILLTGQSLLKTQSGKDWVKRKVNGYQPSCDSTGVKKDRLRK